MESAGMFVQFAFAVLAGSETYSESRKVEMHGYFLLRLHILREGI